MDKKDARIKDLLYLEMCIVNAIHEEIEWNIRGNQSDIVDRIKWILDEKRVRDITQK